MQKPEFRALTGFTITKINVTTFQFDDVELRIFFIAQNTLISFLAHRLSNL